MRIVVICCSAMFASAAFAQGISPTSLAPSQPFSQGNVVKPPQGVVRCTKQRRPACPPQRLIRNGQWDPRHRTGPFIQENEGLWTEFNWPWD